MISFEGNVKVVDFGVAKASHRSVETQSGTVKGKISYLSPEQCRGRSIDRRSDLFSLGIVMWEMLVGDRLFKHPTDYENMEAIVHTTPPAPSTLRAGVPPEVDDIVMKLLARDPAQRYQTGDDLLEAIERVAVRVGVALSAAALGRFVRELFGQRPEPWIEMQAREARPEVVTVTAAPISGVQAELLDSQLANVPDLGTASRSDDSGWPRTETPLPVFPVKPPAATPAATPAVANQSTSWSTPKRKSQLTRIVVAVGLVGLVIGIVVALSGRKSRVDAPVAADAAPAIVIAAVIPDAAVIRDVVPDAMVMAPPIDATVPVDAAPKPHPDAAVRHATPPADAAIERPRPHEPTSDDVARLFRTNQYGEVVATCSNNPKLVAGNSVPCVLSACHTHDAAKARRWLAGAPAARQAALVDVCNGLGVALPSSAKPKNDCDADPMSCRH